MSTSKQKTNHTINLFKLIFALAIAWLHISSTTIKDPGLENFYNYHIYIPFLRMGVPFFFSVTGYFMSHKTDPSYPLKKVQQIWPIFLKLSLFYCLFRYGLSLLQGHLNNNTFHEVNLGFLNTFNLNNILNGTFGRSHLWYLWSLMLGLILFYLAKKLLKQDLLILLLGLFGHLIASAGPLKDFNLFKYGGFPEAFLFLTIGYLVGKYQPRIQDHLIWILPSLFIFFALYYTGHASEDPSIQLMLAIVTAGVMIFVNQVRIPDNFLSQLGKSHSDSIYYFHNVGNDLLPFLFPLLGLERNEGLKTSLLGFSFSILLAVLLGQIMKQIEGRKTSPQGKSFLKTE